MNQIQLLPIKPKQKRSLERYEKILDAVEEILNIKNSDITMIEIAKISGLKRSSLYKYFPSIESIYIGLTERHLHKFSALLSQNIKTGLSSDIFWYLGIFIDVFSIYLGNNKSLVISLKKCDSYDRNVQTLNTSSFATELIKLLNKKNLNFIEDKVSFTAKISIGVLIDEFMNKGHLKPKNISETKKASYSYLSTP